MLHTKHPFSRSSIALTALCLISMTGCSPNETPNAKPTDTNSLAKEVAPQSETVTEQSTGDQSVIAGKLSTVDWESLVGQQVAIEGDLIVVDTYDLVRRGQVKVARNRLYIPTSKIDPNDTDPSGTSFKGGNNVAKVTTLQKENEAATITIDDGSAKQNIFPPTLFPNLGKTLPTVRVGSVINGVSGKIVKAGNNLLLVPEEPLKWTPATRPKRPSVGDAEITVASFNVLNYFTTIDNGRNNARGADSDSEFERQEAKIVSAIVALKADVIGLMEIENSTEAEETLVAALNTEVGKEVFRGCGIPKGFRDAPGGSDAIRVGIIYRSDRVSPADEVSMIDDPAFYVARTPVAQTFKQPSGESFTVIVNHFKSKGGASDANDANKNKGDGQSAYNAARRAQALAISDHIEKLDDQNARVLVIGDLNAYQQEDPIDALRAKGLVDLHEQFQPATEDGNIHYSYLYYGQSGSLDHAFATGALAEDVTGVSTWHINADEPRFLDYNEEFNPKSLFKVDPYRSSDHDPVLIGISNR